MSSAALSQSDRKMAFPAGLQQILGPKPTRGDIATVLIFLPVGLVGDGFLFFHGVPPTGVAGMATATFALGVKRAVEPGGPGRRRVLKSATALINILRNRESSATSTLDKEFIGELIKGLADQIELCEQRVTKPADLEEFVADAAKRLARLHQQP